MDPTPEAIDKTEKEADNIVLTPETIDIFAAFAATLKQVHIRLLAEGYVIKDGIISRSERLQSYEQDNTPHH